MKSPRVAALSLAALLAAGLAARAIATPDAPHVERIGSAASLAPAARLSRAAARSAARTARAARARGALPALPAFVERDPAEVRERLAQQGGGTYIGEILLARDSALARWPDHVAVPLTVWMQHPDALDGWRPEFTDAVHGAFVEWQAAGLPVHFAFVADSAHADVHVAWVDHFAEPISGRTLWARDDRWWIVGGDVTLALRHGVAPDSAGSGVALDSAAVHAIALHEVGHLLGLDHTADVANIMTPKVRVRALAPADVATMRLLYSLPPGSIRQGRR